MKYDEKKKAKIVELYFKHGLSTQAIAERYSTSRGAIARILREGGVDVDTKRFNYAG